MASIKEFFVSISNNVKDKSRSPFYGAFFICWVISNWKPISIFLFSKRDIFFTLEYISKYSSLKNQVFVPLGLALVLMFLIPLFHAGYAYFISFASNIYESGDEFKHELRNNAIVKRANLRELADKVHMAKLAEQDANIAESNKKQAEHELSLKKASCGISNIDDLVNERGNLQKEKDILTNKNADLTKRILHLENSVFSLIKGEEPTPAHLPMDWTGPAKIREFQNLTMKRIRGSDENNS